MSFTFHLPGDAVVPTMTERFAEAEKIENREERWTAQAMIALDTGDMYLVGLVLFKAIQEFGPRQFAERSGEAPARLARLWMPGVLTSVNQAGTLFEHLGVSLPVERFHSARLANFPVENTSVH